jgi:hypothetical protein
MSSLITTRQHITEEQVRDCDGHSHLHFVDDQLLHGDGLYGVLAGSALC